ncbi:MAG: hypothetical protein FD161_1791 [Limisphaerales bacterium]|nr:MAG: hypothetical protein FD161_1791 [Limisphaerales bacterium]TXT47531.1 MAG: hypothetical protein FD140_4228 [Limisphaerales bacterium]
MTAPASLQAQWEAAWPQALAVWSKFTRLRPPRLCLTGAEAQAEGLSGSFAMIRLVDQAVVVSLPQVMDCGVEPFAVEVLAHEIGHHVLAPANLTDHARMLARMRRSLPTVEHHAPMVANLYTDLLINDRLQRGASLRIADVYRALAKDGSGGAVWTLYLRIYELLWSLERGSLGGGRTDDRLEGDAWLGTRLVRSYARDWLDGSGRFAALLLPHLLKDEKSSMLVERWLDTQNAGAGGEPSGLVEEEAGERDGAIHPAADPELSECDSATDGDDTKAPVEAKGQSDAHGQAREPFQYGELLRAAGIQLTDHEAAVRYYRERARPHLIRFPSRRVPESADPLPEGLEPWDIGQPLDTADWLQSVLQSPRVIPGMTTVQRVWGTTEGREPKREPLDLDLYVDSSGSMPNPQQLTSFLTLAGAIIGLSALRAGARVQVTLWSGKHQFIGTDGFVRDETEVLRVLTGFFGGATAFPIHVLRDTYARRRPGARPAHIMVISDDGVSTLFDLDERGQSGWTVAATALERAGGGGTLVLNLPPMWDQPGRNTSYLAQSLDCICRARDEQGWHVHRVADWADLVAFAREFSRRNYAPGEEAAPAAGRSV